MFKLYKLRNFSDIFNDTFGFLRAYGKNYFGNYFIVTTPLLLLLALLMYFVGQIFFEGIFNNIGNPQGNRVIEELFDNNIGFFISMGILASVLFLLIALVHYSFPILYFGFTEKNIRPTANQLVGEMKAKAGRILLFGLLWLVTFLPILVLLSFFCVLLISILIGIPLALILFAALYSWMALSFFDYLNNGSDYFTSFKKGFTILFDRFWTNAGSTAIFYVIIYFVQSIVSLIPYIIGVASIFSDTIENPQAGPSFSVLGIALLITFIVSTLTGFILGNILFINQGIIFYTYMEEYENRSAQTEIDLIGLDSE